MELEYIARTIILDDIKRKKLIESYKNGKDKVYNIKIDYILSSLSKQLNKKNMDLKLLEGYLIFLINISSSLSNEEQKLIINYGNKLIKHNIKILNSNQKLIVAVSLILKEAKKENIEVIFRIDDNESNTLMMMPSVTRYHKTYELKGIITLSSDVLESNLKSDEHLIILLFMFYHEFEHLRELNYLNNTRINSKEKINSLKEFVITFILGCGKFYSYYHDSFSIERKADKYAYIKTISLIEKLELQNQLPLLKLVRKTYNDNRAYDTISETEFEKLLNKCYRYIIKNKSNELKELCLYMPVLKEVTKKQKKLV